MAPKKVSIEKPAVVVEEPPFNPPTETEAEKKARIRAERDAEQKELDNAWKKIPYIDQKDLRPGYYAGMEMDRLWKPWQTAVPSLLCLCQCLFLSNFVVMAKLINHQG